MAATKRMTEGSPTRLLLLFSLPLMLGNVFQQLYTVVDTAIVGQALGVGALASLGSADWMNWFVLGVIQGFAQGFSIRMAQCFGARDEQGLSRAIGMTAVLAAGISVLLLAVCEAAAVPVLRLLKTEPEAMDGAVTYLRVMYAGIPVIMAYNVLASVLRSLGDSRTPLVAMVAASGVNIGLDLLFVVGFPFGIAGAAAATVIAQLGAAGVCLAAVLRLSSVRLTRRDFRPSLPLTGSLLALGFPIALENAVIAVGGMVVQSVVNRYGVLFVAGFTATNKLYGILEIAAVSFGYAVTTYVGQNLGAGDFGRIRRGMRSAAVLGLLTSGVITGLMFLGGRALVGLFISGTPDEVAASTKVAVHYLSLMSSCLAVLYLLYVFRSGLQGLGNALMPMASGIAEFVMRIGVALLLPLVWGQEGIYYAEVAAWLGATALLIPAYFVCERRLERRVGASGKEKSYESIAGGG